MDEDIEVLNPKKVDLKKIAAIFFLIFLFYLILFFSSKAYNLTKKVIVAKSSKASPYLTQDIDFINDLSISSIIKEEDRRINILLLGIGGVEHEGPNLTDTIMVVSVDPINKEAAMLSIPRDLYVPVGDWGSYKINSVYNLGKSYFDKEAESFELVKKIVSDVLGVPIHYFVLVSFEGFEDIIDILGGIEVEVKEDIYDPYYPDREMEGYEGFKIEKGFHVMDGETALKYVRSRKTTSDFDRARRQQEVLFAIRKKAIEKQNIFNIRKITQIINILADNMKTDLQISEIEVLVKIVKNIDREKISTEVIDDDIDGLVYADKYDDMYVLLPYDNNFREIHNFVRQYFKDPFIVREDAKIAIRNGTNINGLARSLAEDLISFGFNVIETSNAEKRDYPNTFIYDYSNNKKKFTVNFLKDKLGGVPVIRLDEEDEEQDIEIIIGQDYKK